MQLLGKTNTTDWRLLFSIQGVRWLHQSKACMWNTCRWLHQSKAWMWNTGDCTNQMHECGIAYRRMYTERRMYMYSYIYTYCTASYTVVQC